MSARIPHELLWPPNSLIASASAGLRARQPRSHAETTGPDWSPAAGVLRFALTMLLSVGLATVVTVVGARALLPPAVWEEVPAQRLSSPREAFARRAAIEAVASRLGSTPVGWSLRQDVRTKADVEQRSADRWIVRLGGAAWSVHVGGVGGSRERVATPDNDAARHFEARAASG